MLTQKRGHKLLLASTPIGPLGSGLGGGVELTLTNVAKELLKRDYHIKIIAPEGSKIDFCEVIEVTGELQFPCQYKKRDDKVDIPANSVLANMWSYILDIHNDYDLIVNFAYDWLPFYLTRFLETPIAHLVSMCSLTNAMDQVIKDVATQFPNTVAVHSRTQANTFLFGDILLCLYNGIDLSLYEFCEKPNNNALAWAGRISPENGLEDALKVSELTGLKVRIFGAIQDEKYWDSIRASFQNKLFLEYVGFLMTSQFQQELRLCRTILVTPKCPTAYSNVALEALACGVPVVAYKRGGISEIVKSGQTGWLVKPDSIEEMVEAVSNLDKIDRFDCRLQAKNEYSLEALGNRLEEWIRKIISQ